MLRVIYAVSIKLSVANKPIMLNVVMLNVVAPHPVAVNINHDF